MYIFAIIWFLFMFVYVAFNAYGIFRVVKMRIKGDIIPVVVLIYVIVIAVIIVATVILIGALDWGKHLQDLIKI
ncbi:MAG: hypothetical protein HW405_11 [Candidatus Berkelbacteria bacterium]|nr:hypothetical protein [Candidatus Berkelbacteria bacterium]